MRLVIVASGKSAEGFEPPPGVVVIAVNGAVDWLSRADYFFTLDPSAANIYRLNNQKAGVIYCYAYTHRLCLYPCVSANFYQRVSAKPYRTAAHASPEWWANRWSSALGLNKNPGEINTGNSAFGALGLAYHLGAKKVALVGVDANTDERIEGGNPNNLSHLPLLFESALGQIELVNCGKMQSRVPQMSISEGMQWLLK